MCLNTDKSHPLCDECLARLKSLPADGEFTYEDMCEDCRDLMQHSCDCCMSYKGDEIVEDGLCKECREQ